MVLFITCNVSCNAWLECNLFDTQAQSKFKMQLLDFPNRDFVNGTR